MTYPYEGCCPHASNAHSRKHCLLCDCERGPVQVTPGPDVPELTKCGMCRALLESEEDRVAHLDWHERLIRTIESLTLAVSGLRQNATRVTDPEE